MAGTARWLGEQSVERKPRYSGDSRTISLRPWGGGVSVESRVPCPVILIDLRPSPMSSASRILSVSCFSSQHPGVWHTTVVWVTPQTDIRTL